MKSFTLFVAAVLASPIAMVSAAPLGPDGPCPQDKVDAILLGDLDPAECCSYGKCKGDVVVSVGG